MTESNSSDEFRGTTPETQAWIDEIKEKIHPTKPDIILEIFRPHPVIKFEILDTIRKIQEEKGSATREGIHNDKVVKRHVPGGDTLDLYLNDLKKTGHISDELISYRKSGPVLNQHEIRVTEKGKKDLPDLIPVIQEFRRIFGDPNQ